MKKKIAIIAYTTFSTDTRVQKEAFAAKEAGYELDIFTLNDSYSKAHELLNFIPNKFVQYKGQSKKKYILSYLKFFLFCFYKLSIYSVKKKYKYIHIHNMPNFLVFSAIFPKILGTKIILDIHDLMPEIFSVKFNLSKEHTIIKMLYLEERLSARFSHEIISTNKFHTKRFRKNKIITSNITEIVNVADENVFYLPQNKKFDQEKLIIAYPSTLAKRLGIDKLIDAVELVVQKGLKIELNIYGDGEYRDEIKSMIENKNLVEFINLSESFISLNKLSESLDKAHIGVIPLPSNASNDIAMPVKVSEFFAKKVCVIASNLPLLKDCFEDIVIFFQEGNSQDLADKIEYLYNNRIILEEYANNGYRYFRSKTWRYYKEKYMLLISSNKTIYK